jgi:hypothetical protein
LRRRKWAQRFRPDQGEELLQRKFAVAALVSIGFMIPVSGQTMRNTTLQGIPIVGFFKTYEINGSLNWIGPFASILLSDVKENGQALESAKGVRTASYFKTGGLLMTPVFLFSAVGIANEEFARQKDRGVENPDMPGSSKLLLGMTLVSFLAFIGGDIAENIFLTRTANAWNSGYGTEAGYSNGEARFSIQRKF